MTKRELIKRAKEQGIRFARLQFSDIHGVTKNVAIPINELDAALEGNIVFDGSCIEGFVRFEEADMYLARHRDVRGLADRTRCAARSALDLRCDEPGRLAV